MAEFKRHDTREPLRGVVRDGNGATVDLTQFSSVRLYAQLKGSSVAVINAPVTQVSSDGSWTYHFADRDLRFVGVYEYELEAIDAEGKRVTFPTKGWAQFTVYDDIAQGELTDTMLDGDVTVTAETKDTSNKALGTVPVGAIVTAVLANNPVAEMVSVDGSFALTLKSGLLYTIFVTKVGLTLTPRSVKV